MKLWGHRGASADYPENTVEAMRGAVAQGADGVELDVMVCGSGELVVCHDEWLDRLAGRRWEVATTPWWKLQKADVGSQLGFAPARIPLLEDVFAAVPADFFVNIELKCITVDDLGLTAKVVDFVRAHRLESRVVLSSFNAGCLFRLARFGPELRRGCLIDPDQPWLPQAWGVLPTVAPTAVHPHVSACTPERVARWHAQQWQVAVWTVDDVDEARRLRALGVDAIITNRPGRLRAELEAGIVEGAG
ncbi:MAG: glycerophosphodiester phosphodiesterase [Archangium sp.]|nr:glycerophosphodiester phosphodiesterase [Archangium sp.]